MIEFNGTSEESWMKTPADHINFIMKQLHKYKKDNPTRCPFLGK